MSPVKPIPDGYTTVTPYLVIKGAGDAIEFYKRAFGATELLVMPDKTGRISHAELQIGTARIMLAEEHAEISAFGPTHYGGSPVSFLLYVEDVDSFVSRAVSAGAKVTRPIADQFYGDRSGGIEDPFGHKWYVSTHIKDVSNQELEAAAAQN
jgi:PhnB protein